MSNSTSALKAYLQRSVAGTLVQKLVLISNVLLLVFCAVMLINLLVLFRADNPAPKAVPRAAQASVAGLRWNWFNGAAAPASIEADDLDDLANATIKAKLLGVVIGERTSAATISFNGRPEQVYHVDDKLGASVVIKQIQPLRIIVEQNGAKRQILLEKADNVMETEQVVETDQDQAADEGFAMANMFGALPVQVDNYGSGFKLNKLSDEMKMLADIEDGDVVVDVGGSGIQELMSDPSLWVNYTNESSLPVTIIRDGEPVVVYVNAASLSAKMLPKLGLNK